MVGPSSVNAGRPTRGSIDTMLGEQTGKQVSISATEPMLSVLKSLVLKCTQ
jgi:hypothetical protein